MSSICFVGIIEKWQARQAAVMVTIKRESSCPPQGLLQEGNGDGERGLRSRRSLAEEDERVDSACSGAFSNQRI